ncbi:MAG: FecR domain-containing protein [Myxococcota bacterium]|nr:FecR domain-containing protein [Myxococcota bacterium]
MTDLDALAKALRKELGKPPEAWQKAQRERMREVLATKPERPLLVRLAPVLALSLVAVCALLWFGVSRQHTEAGQASLPANDLAAPIRFEDGSSIVLAKGGRGRLSSGETTVRFELETGRADFDVVPNQKRKWTITAGKNEVTVVGTRFSVSYEPSGAFEVGVERGVVSVRVPERRASVELKAGDHLRGGPGRMEVVQGAAVAAEPAAGERVPDEALEPTPEASASVAPVAPASSAPPQSAEWRDRYRDGQYAEALTLLRASRAAERLESLGPRMLADIADVARLGGDLKLAARALGVLLRQYPRASEARDAQFLLGRVHALSGDRGSAIRAFESYLETGSSKRYANEAAGRLMELYTERGDTERARAMAERYLTSAPNGPYRRLALSLTR